MSITILPLLFFSVLTLNTLTVDAKEQQPPAISSESHSETSLMYVSDFFAFIGTDERGKVVFALDNNRGRDEETWQAEHLLSRLYAEPSGWIDLEGEGSFTNTSKQLTPLPNSPTFQFEGTPAKGITIKSPRNTLTLNVEPIPTRKTRTHNNSTYRMGSASGTLDWQGRTIQGIVIHEHLWMPGFNRLTRTYTDLWTESHGLYLTLGNRGDHLYLHSQKEKTRLSPLFGHQAGLGILAQKNEPMKNLQLEVVQRQQALGFYRWPSRWEGSWEQTSGKGSFTLEALDLKVISNFLVGGLAMGMVTGEVKLNGQRLPVYGLIEVLM